MRGFVIEGVVSISGVLLLTYDALETFAGGVQFVRLVRGSYKRHGRREAATSAEERGCYKRQKWWHREPLGQSSIPFSREAGSYRTQTHRIADCNGMSFPDAS